ncbi:hypothetical protein BDR07DRAFT_1388003 [Suillus spraguei]|nr:hypothetical protein BDR07DRAFT_1388003 [Suillus spraguei]
MMICFPVPAASLLHRKSMTPTAHLEWSKDDVPCPAQPNAYRFVVRCTVANVLFSGAKTTLETPLLCPLNETDTRLLSPLSTPEYFRPPLQSSTHQEMLQPSKLRRRDPTKVSQLVVP